MSNLGLILEHIFNFTELLIISIYHNPEIHKINYHI